MTHSSGYRKETGSDYKFQVACRKLNLGPVDKTGMRALRDTDPEKVHLITSRTRNAELLFAPRSEINALLGGIIARYASRHEIELYGYCVLGNHYHMLCRAPQSNLAGFAEDVNKQIAIRVNRLLGRSGSLWGKRYNDQITIKEVDQLRGLIYVLTNPVKHGLVTQPHHWPGLTSYHQHFGTKPKEYRFMRWSDYHAAKRRAQATGDSVHIEDFQDMEVLKVSMLPVLKAMKKPKREAFLRGLLEEKVKEIHSARRAAGKKFLGRKKVLQQPAQGRFPKEVSSSRPRYYADDPETLREEYEAEAIRRATYSLASFRFRSGDLSVKFPPFCHRPPLHHRPQSAAPPG